MYNSQDLWNQTRDKLAEDIAPSSFDATFENVTRVAKDDNGVIYVITPSPYIKRKINNTYYSIISKILSSLTKENVKFKFVCEEELKETTKVIDNTYKLNSIDLNQNYTFESYVVVESNRMAYLTSLKVAESDNLIFNPLYIFGDVGLGKTHLMQAIGNYIADGDLNKKILYVQANDFLSDYSKATRDKNMKPFEDKYENIDVLLVDDIQMLAKKDSTQQQFFKIFDSMDNNRKQIVITSDRPASKLNDFMDRLKSRFQKGVSVNINQPNLNQRVSILERKVAEMTELKFDKDILVFIAENFTNNIRELEGALNRVILYLELNNETPSLKIAEEALADLIESKSHSGENYENALSVIADFYKISIADLLGNSRLAKYVLPRHISIYILKEKYKLTFSKIGRILNGRDHSTILNGYNRICEEKKTNKELSTVIDNILTKIGRE